MGLNQLTKYADRMATLSQWGDIDTAGVVQADMMKRVRENPASSAVVMESITLLKQTWTMLPPAVRGQALGALSDAMDTVAGAWENSGLEDIPIVNIVVMAVDGVSKIVQAVKGSNDVKRAGSDYAKGSACMATIGPALKSRGAFTVCPNYMYARFIKIRGGGDYDKLTAFHQAGGARDAIFTGRSTPGPTGDCSKKLRRKIDESFGPFAPKCGKSIGISALFFPWWSAVYPPWPMTRWEGSPKGASFQAGLSPDTNAALVKRQTAMIADPAVNATLDLRAINRTVDIFQQWWGSHPGLRRVRWTGDGLETTKDSSTKRIDAKRVAGHVPAASAAAYWFYDDFGRVTPYPGQAGASLQDGRAHV